jgi:hypothetical protein
MSKRTKPQPTDAVLAALKAVQADADIINLAKYNDAADARRLVEAVDADLVKAKAKVNHLYDRNAAGKVDDDAVVDAEMIASTIERYRHEAWAAFERASDVWRATQAVANAAAEAVAARRNDLLS